MTFNSTHLSTSQMKAYHDRTRVFFLNDACPDHIHPLLSIDYLHVDPSIYTDSFTFIVPLNLLFSMDFLLVENNFLKKILYE